VSLSLSLTCLSIPTQILCPAWPPKSEKVACFNSSEDEEAFFSLSQLQEHEFSMFRSMGCAYDGFSRIISSNAASGRYHS